MPVKKLSCHKPQDSLLTSSSGYTNYRGVLNLCIILLVLSNARVALENVIKYGILVDFLSIARSLHDPTILPTVQIFLSLGVFIAISYLIEKFISHPSSKLRSFLSTSKVEKIAVSLVVLNTSLLVILPAYVVYSRDCHAVFSSISLSFTSVIFLKLISYHMTNYWYRNIPKNSDRSSQQQRQLTPTTAPAATVKGYNNNTTANSPNNDLKCTSMAKDNNNVNKTIATEQVDGVASSISNNKSNHGESTDDLVEQTTQEQTSQTDKVNSTNDEMNVTRRNVAKDISSDKNETKITQSTMSTLSPSKLHQSSTGKSSNSGESNKDEPKEAVVDEDSLEIPKEKLLVEYPNNITIKDIAYFISVPTLCYEANFPRTSRIRKRFLIKRAIECLFLSQLMLGLVQQWLIPTISNSIGPLKQMDYAKMAERLLKLADVYFDCIYQIPNHIIWLIGFYWFFHSCFNFWAEVMRFADREFYRDWWNSCSVQYFWANWNIPVHKWCLRHLYIPLLSLGCTKSQASVMVFLVSAFFHEYLVSVPLKMFRVWAFSGMLFQVPFAYFVSTFEHHPQWANTAVWVSLILGQPLCILMYYHDYYIANFIN